MEILRQHVEALLSPALAALGINNEHWKSMISVSREKNMGDLSLPCFAFAKQLSMAPNEIAEKLKAAIETNDIVDDVNSTAGYLNFKASRNWLAEYIISGNIRIGDAEVNSTDGGKSVLIEHTSANPNGPFHVGRARNAILGDTIVRLNRLCGNNVRSEYYVDDMGKQVAVLAWALANLDADDVERILSEREPVNEMWKNKPDHNRVRWYQAAQVLRNDDSKKDDIEKAIGDMVHASENGNHEVLTSFENAYQPVLEGMLETLNRLRINFDEFTKESIFVTNGDVSNIMQKLSTLEIHGVADNGAEYLDLGARGLKGKTEFYYKRGDGSSLYATRDIAYHIWKYTQCDTLINVLGEDHKLQSKQVSMTLNELGHDAPEVLFYSFIKLPEGKMSTRKGNVVFMDDLLEEAKAHAAEVVREIRTDYSDEQISHIAEAVGTSAVRFNIIKVSPDKGFTFRWEEALSFDADSAPFIMYSHTRSRSIAKKCSELGVANHAEDAANISKHSTDIPDSMFELLRVMATHNDALMRSVEQNRPNLFANQLLNLANHYNGFYRDCKVISNGEVNQTYLAVSEIASELLRSGMIGLGIEPLERM
jgi:arginyl-tRNA synthetase